jgi:DNA-binding MarR family transcriptional regulator
MRRPAISELEDHLGYWLRFVSNHVSAGFARKVEEQGVTVGEWVLLRELLEADRASPSQLAERLGMTRGAISKLVERVERKNLLTRTSSGDDRRYQSLALTPAGQRLVPVLARLADDNDRACFGHLKPREHARLMKSLQDLVDKHGWKERPLT